MNVLLTTINAKYIHQNLAVRLLYELNKDYENIVVKEFFSKSNSKDIIDFCSQFQIIAFSCYIWNITRTLEIAEEIKKLNPSSEILLGGPEVSYNWEDIIALPAIDYVISGEGEIPFSLFLKLYPNKGDVPGLIWKNGRKTVENPGPEIFNLNLLLNCNPYLSIPPEELKNKISYIETSRGCPCRCGYCLAGLQNKVRYLPKKSIETNLLYLMERGRTIKFLDRTFNTHPAFAISVFKFILEHYRPGNIFQFEIKADLVQEEFVEFVKSHVPKGIFRFEIGIQTLNRQSNREVNRKQNFENLKTFVEHVREHVEIHLDLIIGLPYDYFSDIKYSFEEVFKLFAPELQLGFLKFLKGTPIRNDYKKHDYHFQVLPPYQIIESRYLSRDDLERIALVEHTLDIFWNRKRATYVLKYVALKYSIFDFLEGLGNYWKERNELKNNGLIDIYEMISEFSRQFFPEDCIVQELIALDYYLHHKVKPGIRFLPELPKKEQQAVTKALHLHSKYRYVMHKVHFSVQKPIDYGLVEPEPGDLLIIKYTGIDFPVVLINQELPVL